MERISTAFLVAMMVGFFATSLSVSPRIAALGMLVVIGLSLYNSRRRFNGRRNHAKASPADSMRVSMTAAGLETTRGAERTSSRWMSLVRTLEGEDGMMLSFIDGTVRWVPNRAFQTAAERQQFVEFVSQFMPVRST